MERDITRRSTLALVGGTTVALAGCTGVLGTDESTGEDDNRLTVDVEGNGPTEPVTVSVSANDIEFEETVSPGEEFHREDTSIGSLEVSVDYEDDLDVDVEWELDDIEVEVELEQDVWERTTVESSVVLADGNVAFDSDVAIELPDSSTEMTVTDERPAGEWEFELEIEVDDEDRPEITFEVEDED